MQIWRFYLIKSKTDDLDQWRDGTVDILSPITDDSRVYASTEYPLYAITNSKKIAKRFMAERDMKKFIKNSTKNCAPEDWAELANQNNSCILKFKKLTTAASFKNSDGFYSIKVPVLMTEGEYTNVTSESGDEYLSDLLGQYFECDMISPFCIKDKYRAPLCKLKYDGVYFVFNQSSPEIKLWDSNDVYSSMNLYTEERREMLLAIDELNNFIKSYKTLFR